MLMVYFSFQSIGLDPAKLVLHSARQLKLYSELAKDNRLILHIDATGGIIKKAQYVKKQMFLFSAVVDDPTGETEAVSVSDFLTEQSLDEDVSFWLKKIRNDVARMENIRFASRSTCPSVAVMDFSWVIIYAALDVFCQTSLVQYLQDTFQRCIKNDDECPQTTVLFSCSSHFISRAAKTLSRFFSNTESTARKFLLSCVGLLICSPDLYTAGVIWKTMLDVFGRPKKDSTWQKSYANLKRLMEGCEEVEHAEEDFEDEGDCQEATHATGRENKPLREMSPYSSYFANPDEISNTEEVGEDNELFRREALAYIYQVWLPTYGLWGQPALRGVKNVHKYLTNAIVESWFR